MPRIGMVALGMRARMRLAPQCTYVPELKKKCTPLRNDIMYINIWDVFFYV